MLTVVADRAVVNLDICDAGPVTNVEGASNQIGDVLHLPGQVDLVVGNDAALLHVQNLRGGVPRAKGATEDTIQLETLNV